MILVGGEDMIFGSVGEQKDVSRACQVRLSPVCTDWGESPLDAEPLAPVWFLSPTFFEFVKIMLYLHVEKGLLGDVLNTQMRSAQKALLWRSPPCCTGAVLPGAVGHLWRAPSVGHPGQHWGPPP